MRQPIRRPPHRRGAVVLVDTSPDRHAMALSALLVAALVLTAGLMLTVH